MITDDKPLSIETNLPAGKNFTIKASAKAFQILSSKLYSDKIQACLRELGTNAWDATVMAGKNCPFDVKLPSRFDSSFAIRDYGTGLSRSDMENLYTTYFESNKTNSNDVTGCLGLGSKSPFAYTDSFCVTSWFNGKKYDYIVYLSEGGFPAITFVGEVDTTEQNGLRVSFDVKAQDCQEFINKARTVYRNFKVKPNFLGKEVTFVEPKVFMSSDNFDIVERANYNDCYSWLVMGNVSYPISISNYGRIFSYKNLIIKAKIGDVDITASREELEYTQKTTNYLEEIKKEIEQKLKDYCEELIKTAPNLWAASAMYNDESSWWPDNITWNGKNIRKMINVAELSITKDYKGCNNFRRYYHGGEYKYKLDSVRGIQPSKNIQKIFVNDLQAGAEGRLKKWANENLPTLNGQALVFFDTNAADVANFLGCDLSLIEFTSTLPKVVYQKGANVAKKPVKVRKFHNCGYLNMDEVDSTEIQPGDIYVESESCSITTPKMDSLKILKQHGIVGTIYVIPKSVSKDVDKTKLIRGDDFVQKFLDNHKAPDYLGSHYMLSQLRPFFSSEPLIKNKVLLEMIQAGKDCEKNQKVYSALSDMGFSGKKTFSLDKLGMLGYIIKQENSGFTRIVKVEDAIKYVNELQ